MIDLYLKSADKTEMETILIKGGFERSKESGELHHPRICLDAIGDIHKPTGGMITSEGGYEYPVLEKLVGYHVNLRVLDDELAGAFLHACCDCKTPSRVWA